MRAAAPHLQDARAAARHAALAARRVGLRRGERRAGLADRGEAVFGRRESVGPVDRSRRARRSVERAARRSLRLDGNAGHRAAQRHRGRDRLRARRTVDERRRRRGFRVRAQQDRGRQRRRPDRHDRRPRRRAQIARSVRVPGQRHAHRGAHRARAAGAHARRTAAQSRTRPALRRADLRRAVVRRRCAARSTRSTGISRPG